MKKIIAAAVATAFVAPAFAADISVSGDIEYRYVMSADDGIAGAYDDSDIKVTATEELANGMTITAFVELLDAKSTASADVGATAQGGDTEIIVSMPGMGTVSMGAGDHAANRVDELGSPADTGMGAASIAASDGTTLVTNWTLPQLVNGLTVNVSAGLDDSTQIDSVDNETNSTSYGLSYNMGSFTVAYGAMDTEGAAYSPSYIGAQFSAGALTVGVDSASDDGLAGTDSQEIGATYNLGDTAVYVQTQSVATAGGSTVNSSAFGVLHSVGGGLQLRAESINSDTATDDQTTIAVLYAF
jgi:hypothetical protein